MNAAELARPDSDSEADALSRCAAHPDHADDFLATRGERDACGEPAGIGRAPGDEQVRCDGRVETRIRGCTRIGGEYGFVTAFVRERSRSRPVLASRTLPLRTTSSDVVYVSPRDRNHDEAGVRPRRR
jgi:hypothetical protein